VRRRLGLVIALAVVGIAAPSRTARACSCLPPPAPGLALEQADVVFEGRPYAAAVEGGQTRYSFEVDRFWKGEPGDRVDVETASSSAACGRSYEIGTPYLVYARHVSEGVLGDTLCSRTRTMMAAEEDIEVLGAPRSPDEPRSGDRPDTEAPPREPPRIPTADPPEPPPTAPSRRGCATEMPHTPSGGLAALLFSLGLATRRRRSGPDARW
jgi:MYXO-CTERM domain-containing protein